MTLQELLTQLSSLAGKVGPDGGESQADLELLILQLEKQVVAEGFQPLAGLAALAAVDDAPLLALMAQVDQAIADEQARAKLIGQIVSLAKAALAAAGVKLP